MAMTSGADNNPIKDTDGIASVAAAMSAIGVELAAVDAVVKSVAISPSVTSLDDLIALDGMALGPANNALLQRDVQIQRDQTIFQPVLDSVKVVAKEWPATRSGLVLAASLTVRQADTVAALGDQSASAASMAAALTSYVNGPLKILQTAFADAKASLNTSNDNTAALYRAGKKFISDLAQTNIHLLHQEYEQLQREIDDGASSAALQNKQRAVLAQIAVLRKTPVPMNKSDPDLKYTSGLVVHTSTALDAISKINTSFEQVTNKIKDMSGNTSPDKALMSIFLKTFKTQFAAAVDAAKKFDV